MEIGIQMGLTLSFKAFLAITDLGISRHNQNRPRVVCKDGFNVSIQRSHLHYCDLQTDLSGDFYSIPYPDDISETSYELGYPSEKDDLIMEYAETPDDPTGTVYGFVPYDTVVKLLERHGGIVFVCD